MSTPLMKQYAQVKAQHPDTILLFRMGDFFETFEEDAKVTSRVLGITLTRRGNGAAGEIPLAGFPHHALDAYLPKLLKAGHRVAVCEQMEDPRFAKGIVKREVIEVVTPGVAFSDRVLEQKQNNYLAAIALPSALAGGDDVVGFAYIDVSTAEFRTSEFPLRALPEQVASIAPAEIIIQKRDREALGTFLKNEFSGLFSSRDDWVFTHEFGYERLTTQLGTQSLKGFGLEERPMAVVAAGAIMQYLQETQKSNLLHIRRITPYEVGDHMVLDPATKRNLEILTSSSGAAGRSLLEVLDRTRTPMGARMLKQWVNYPLNTVAPIRRRLEAVGELVGSAELRNRTSEALSPIGDLERLNTRICTARATPRDLVALKCILGAVGGTQTALAPARSEAIVHAREALDPLPETVELLEKALSVDPPALLADGGAIREGYNAELDDLRQLASHGKQWIADLQRTERERTGISSLKVGFNNVFGYFIEVTNTHKEKIPGDYIRKQTLANAERFVTPELKEYEEKILHAEERMLALETRLFGELRLALAERAEVIQRNARELATIDCLCSLAQVAVDESYSAPEVNDTTALDIVDGRHPVIERLLGPGEHYVANSVHLDTEHDQILIITGPNMSGKSSFLRQTGLIILLAQIGSFVPAKTATIGVVDRIFTRVGASDNISSGESTFLVEMHEAAHIVNTATARSFILLDEVGRGTSTFDGISIAWSLTEYLHERVGARTLFATHYHELNELAELFARIKNFKVEVREYGDKVVFLHKVTPGFADHSYGIHVAKMAGLPDEITDRARTILKNLEGSDLTVHDDAGRKKKGRIAGGQLQLTLFEMKDEALRKHIGGLDLDSMTPLDALKALAALQRQVKDS
ncbi:MAG TPA: DNA mismatch repair protein MutS [Bacteroidota bacterium]|nr:DNA mismatch repair protein MutS [Bacteroidota bacterium]